MTAESPDRLADALASLTAKVAAGRYADRQPPTEADLLAQRADVLSRPNWRGCPEVEHWREADDRLAALYPAAPEAPPMILPPQWMTGPPRIEAVAAWRHPKPGEDVPLAVVLAGPHAGKAVVPLDTQTPETEAPPALLAYTGSGAGGDRLLTPAEVDADALEAKLPHPLAPLVECWHACPMPQAVEAETRPDPIYPAVLTMTKPDHGRRESRPHLVLLAGQSSGPRQLPMFGPEVEEYGGEFLASVLPVEMYRTAGSGAPLAVRLLLRAVLDARHEDRLRHGPLFLPRTPWREVVAEVYPGGNYQPARMWPGCQRAIEALNADPRFAVPIPTGEGGFVGKRVVTATEHPLTGHRSEWIRFLVDLPEGAALGPVAWRAAWFLAATHSTARFALATGLAVLWDRPGVTRVKPARRAPFIQSADFRRYDILSRRALASLTWPNGWPNHYRRPRAEAEAVEHLHVLAKHGYCRIRREGGGYRTMPGLDWPGWTPAQRGKLLAP